MFSRIFSKSFFQSEQLKKKTNFLLAQNSFFFLSWPVEKGKKNHNEYSFKKNHRCGIRDWWNYLMNLLKLRNSEKNYVFRNRIDVAVDKSLCASLKASIACCLGKPMSPNKVMLASVGSGATAGRCGIPENDKSWKNGLFWVNSN